MKSYTARALVRFSKQSKLYFVMILPGEYTKNLGLDEGKEILYFTENIPQNVILNKLGFHVSGVGDLTFKLTGYVLPLNFEDVTRDVETITVDSFVK